MDLRRDKSRSVYGHDLDEAEVEIGVEMETNDEALNSESSDSRDDPSQDFAEEKILSVPKPRSKKPSRNAYAREYYRRRHPFRPVYKTDIRRQLGLMWINVLNWNNPFVMRSFLKSIAARDCEHKHYYNVLPHFQMMLPTALPCALTAQTVLHAAYCALTTPDVTCHIVACRVTQSPQERGSKVVVRVRFAGTKLYNVSPGVLEPLQRAVDDPANGVMASDDECVLIPSLPHLDWESLHSMRLALTWPVSIGCEGDFVFSLDEQHSMRTWEFHHIDMWGTPLASAFL